MATISTTVKAATTAINTVYVTFIWLLSSQVTWELVGGNEDLVDSEVSGQLQVATI